MGPNHFCLGHEEMYRVGEKYIALISGCIILNHQYYEHFETTNAGNLGNCAYVVYNENEEEQNEIFHGKQIWKRGRRSELWSPKNDDKLYAVS